jgi:hypothetical protein
VALPTVLVTPLVAWCCAPAAGLAPLVPVAGGGVVDTFAGAAGWLAGCGGLTGWVLLGWVLPGWLLLAWVVLGWVLPGWFPLGWAGPDCDEPGGAAGSVEPDCDELDDGGGADWVRLLTVPLTVSLAVPVSELSADPAPLERDESGFVAAAARPAKRNAKMSAAAIPPQTHKQTLRARPEAPVRVADPSTGRRLPPESIMIHTYPPVLSGQNRRRGLEGHLAA